MITRKEKGFTIIELLVVVAIIAVLAAIVLVNVTQYINRGKDAAIKGNMATILTNMAVWYDDKGNYDNGTNAFTGDQTYTVPENAIENAKAQTVVSGLKTDTNDQICVCAELYANGGNNTYCIDYRGYKNETANPCSSRCTGNGTLATSGQCSD